MACRIRSDWTRAIALICSVLIAQGDVAGAQQQASAPQAQASQAQTSQAQASQAQASQGQASNPLPPDALDSLVAPIALYPDPLLAQVLAAATYPLEIIQLQQWLTKHKDLKDKALA